MRGICVLVAIAGGSGSGKTWLADRLHEVFHQRTARLSLDDFYFDRSYLPQQRRDRVNFDKPDAIDWTRVEQVLLACKRGLPVQRPRYDFVTHTRSSDGDWLEPRPLFLVDGLWLFHKEEIRDLFDLRIYIQCPEKIRFERRLKRDSLERGRTREQVRQQFFDRVAPMHERYVEPQSEYADILLSEPPTQKEIDFLRSPIMALMQRQGPSSSDLFSSPQNYVMAGRGFHE